VVTGVLVALDYSDLAKAESMAARLAEVVSGFKVGLELLTAVGPSAVERIASLGKPVFVDAKLHDIPTTVERAGANLRDAGARWVTAHAGGGQKMLAAAVGSMGDNGGILAVTILTSFDDDTSLSVGFVDGVRGQVARMAALAGAAGAEGVVCSALEVDTVRRVEPGLKVVTPGIRLAGDASDDQARVVTPLMALAAGADYMVIGRSITASNDPVRTANEIRKSLDRSG
jgi:orotidine-5'-phosphate decarboxylase